MVVIRLARAGTKKRPFYHVVVADSRCARDGRYVERLGYFNPLARGKECQVHVDATRLEHWLKTGAQASVRVKNIVRHLKNTTAAA
jgi:small subunit ribosomal protein S16